MIKTYLTNGLVIDETNISAIKHGYQNLKKSKVSNRKNSGNIDPFDSIKIRVKGNIVPALPQYQLEDVNFFDEQETLNFQERTELDKIRSSAESDREKYMPH